MALNVTVDDYKILRQIFLRTLMYEAEALWAREFLARVERAIAIRAQEQQEERMTEAEA